MGVYNNNKDGTRTTIANTIQVVDAPMEQFVSKGEFSAVTPNDVSADNKLVAENEVTKAVDTMPSASEDLVGTIVQYVGTTTANYTNGYFYRCVSDGALDPTYSWSRVDVQPSEGSGGNLPWVTPQDYGAVGDGVTDDSVAVAQALANNNEIYFPEGTYALSKQLVLNDNQKVFGAGSGKTTLLFTSNDMAEGQTYDRGRVVTGVSTYLESQTLAHDITLSGMTLTSNYDGQSTSGKTLLLLTNCKDVYVEDVSCIVTSDDAHDANAMEVLENGHDITFVNCYFEQGQEVGTGCVEIRNTYSEKCSNIKFFNCNFYKTGGVDEIFAIFTVAHQEVHSLIDGVLCDGCRFESNPSANASSHAYDIEVTWGDTKNIVFTNCEFISKDTSVATIKRLNHDSTNMEQVVFDHCTIKATRDSSASTRSPIFYIEDITSEDGIIQYLNGSVYGEGKTSLMSNYRAADVVNCDIDCYIDGATCIDSTIYTGSRTRMGNGSSRFIGCDIRHDSAITTAFLIQASIVKDCIYRSGRTLTVQFAGANRDCIVEGNTFGSNVSINDYSTSNIAIDIVANNFNGDMYISSITSSVIRRYAIIDNLVGGNATVGGSSKVTVRRGNSFDGRETPDEQVQKSTMPTASEARLGKVYQYVGETTSSFTNGYFYKCVSDGESTPTYSWEQTDVQPGGGSADLPWVTPQDYGAVGDGVTDDTTAIRSAFNAVNTAGGGTVFFPKGVYVITPTIRIYSNTTVIGDKGESIVIVDQTYAQSGAMFQIGNSTSGAATTTNVHVRGMTFRGSETYGDPQGGLGIMGTWNAKHISFVDCLFQNNMYCGIKLIDTSNVDIFNTRFEAVDCGVIAQGSWPVNDVTIRGCHFTGLSSLNNFTNYNSESVSAFCGQNTDPCERWRIEDCIFEHKLTVGICFAATSIVAGSGHVANKNCIVRNCSFSGINGTVTAQETEDLLIDGLYFDGAAKVMPNNVHTLLHFKSCNNIIVKNVVSKSKEFSFTLLNFSDLYNSNIIIDGFDAIVPYSSTSTPPSAIIFKSDANSSLKNSNIIIKNAVLRANVNNTPTSAYIQYGNLEDSYIDVVPYESTLVLSHYLPTAAIGKVANNKIIVNTENNNVRRTWSPSISVADGNEWIPDGDGAYNVASLPNSVNQQRMPRAYNVTIPNQANYDASLAITDFYLMNDGYDFYINFVASSYTAGKTFTFAKTGNIVPIDKPFIFSNDYKVVCHFVQKNAKWVEVERTLEYYEGADVDVPAIEPMAVTTLPTASASEEGNIYLYMGASDAVQRLSQGATYKCVSDGEGGYGWLMVAMTLETLSVVLQNSTTFDDFKAMILGN